MSKGPDNVVEEVKTVNKNRTTRSSPTVLWMQTKVRLHRGFKELVVYEQGLRMRCGYADQLKHEIRTQKCDWQKGYT